MSISTLDGSRLILCSDLIVSKLSDSAPCISKPRDFTFSREPPAVPKPRKVSGNWQEFEQKLKSMEKKAKVRTIHMQSE
jgi:hypothetical protein